MKKLLLCLFIIFVAFSSFGCGGNSDHSYRNALTAEGEDVGDSNQIQNALFNKENWKVISNKNIELREYIAKLLQKKSGPEESKIQINEAYYIFDKNTKHLTINLDCSIDNQHRILKIDCGQVSVQMSSLITGNEWLVSLFDENNTIINETWTGSYNKKQSEKKFRDSEIRSAKIKDNVIRIIFNTNIIIESIQ